MTQLFCFPHSGATTSVFRRWQATESVSLSPIDRPGRGLRSRSRPAENLKDLLRDQASQIIDVLTRRPGPWAVFGHSFGSVLGYLTAIEVSRHGHEPARCVIVSAGLPPALHTAANEVEALDDTGLDEHLLQIGATPRAVLKSPLGESLRRQFREDHRFRADFHRYTEVCCTSPVAAVAATDDGHAPPERMAAWEQATSGPWMLHEIPGDHFALLNRPEIVLDLLTQETP